MWKSGLLWWVLVGSDARLGNEILILSPGVGVQGGKVGGAISAGADFEMVGRSIYKAENPGEVAEKIWGELKLGE